MKILEINKFNYTKGGAERHFLDVVSLLKSAGHNVAIFSMKSPRNLFSPWQKYFVSYVGFGKEDSLMSKFKGLFRIYSFSAKRKIGKLLDDFKPEIVHIHNIYHHISPSILGEIKKRNIPIVMTVHDYHLISPDREEYLEAVGRKYWKFIFVSKKYSLLKKSALVLKSYFEDLIDWKSKIDAFIAPSQFVAEKLITAGIDKEKINVIPHFISNNSKDNYAEKKEGKNLSREYAFYFGRISKEKGAMEMLETFRKIGKIKLLLAGEIEDDLKIVSDKNVNYLGYLKKNQIEKYIKNAKFCVSFSRLPETFGLIALESIGFGKPFIGLDSGAYKEVIEQGKTGFICKDILGMKDVIEKVIKNELIFSENAIAKIAHEKFGQEKYLEKLIGLFNSLKLKI